MFRIAVERILITDTTNKSQQSCKISEYERGR
jgi:hypothetical protein